MVKRYEHEDKCGGEYDCRMYECSTGDYVAYVDYEKLLDANPRRGENIMDAHNLFEYMGCSTDIDEADNLFEFAMEKSILEQIKMFIKGMNDSEPMTKLRHTDYVEGYKAGLEAIEAIIRMGEAIAVRDDLPDKTREYVEKEFKNENSSGKSNGLATEGRSKSHAASS